MSHLKKPKVVEIPLEFDQSNLSDEDRIILNNISLITHIAVS